MELAVDGFDRNNGRGEKFSILFSEKISVEDATKVIAEEFGSFRGRKAEYLVDNDSYPPCGIVDPKAQPDPDFPGMKNFPGSLVYVRPKGALFGEDPLWDIYEIREGNEHPGVMKQFMDYLSAK